MSEPEILDDDIPAAPVVALTRSQLTVYESLRDHGTLYYSGAASTSSQQLKPRLYPLLAGPTGSGKSFLVEQVARELQADYFRITYGDFIPMGARDVNSATLVRLGRKLAQSDRVVVHIDELDKWLAGDREWSRSITTDLWNLLDGKLPWEQVLLLETGPMSKVIPAEGATPTEGGEENEADLPDNMFRTDHMWVVGSGTWQAIFETRNARSIGFQTKAALSEINNDRELAEAIRDSKVIPTELTARFATDILVLGYPSRRETEQLLEFHGLKQLAAELGMPISADDVDYGAAGMRALESLKTRLLLESLRRRRRAELLQAKAGPDPE